MLSSDPNQHRDSRKFQGITRRFVASMALLSIAAVILVIPLIQLGASVLAPVPFEYRNLPFQVCAPASTTDQCLPSTGSVFHPGDVLPFVVERCSYEFFDRDGRLPYIVSRDLVNSSGTRVILPSLATEVPSNGCDHSITLAHQIPESVAPGEYYLEGVATVYGQFRIANAYFRTQSFTIVKDVPQ